MRLVKSPYGKIFHKIKITMEEQIITFKTARLAREKGFFQKDYPCFGDDGNIHTVAYFKTAKDDMNSYFQSTQSLLQKWLRETHKIEVFILPLFKEKCGYDSFKRAGFSFEIIIEEPCQYLDSTKFNRCLEDRLDEDSKDLFNPIFKKYEEALEIALHEALKLI